ncbi:MAG: hypothetical protein LUQ26_00630 [Methylococcaceae bacterium]|nr:hypothetical protein [Methylococcaceae bacterium]
MEITVDYKIELQRLKDQVEDQKQTIQVQEDLIRCKYIEHELRVQVLKWVDENTKQVMKIINTQKVGNDLIIHIE